VAPGAGEGEFKLHATPCRAHEKVRVAGPLVPLFFFFSPYRASGA